MAIYSRIRSTFRVGIRVWDSTAHGISTPERTDVSDGGNGVGALFDPFYSCLGRRAICHLATSAPTTAIHCGRDARYNHRNGHLFRIGCRLPVFETPFRAERRSIGHLRNVSLEPKSPVRGVDAGVGRHRVASRVRNGSASGSALLDQLCDVPPFGRKPPRTAPWRRLPKVLHKDPSIPWAAEGRMT